MDIVRFVDSITAAPATRLDLNDGVVWGLNYDGTDLSPPALKEAWAGTLLADGELQTASAYGNRQLKLNLDLIAASVDDAAAKLQALWRELNRTKNVLMWQPEGSSAPVFFRTMRSSNNHVAEYPGGGDLRTVDVTISAEPFAYGPKETISPVTVFNDPAEGNILNANPYFDVDVSDWTYTSGVTSLTRSTAVVYPGAKGSMLITPAGGVSAITAGIVTRCPIAAGATVTARARVYMPTAWTDVRTGIDWYDGSGTFLSGSTGSVVGVSANTWTLVSSRFTAPAGAASAVLRVRIGNTPTPSNLCYVYEATLRQYDVASDVAGCSLDVGGVKGDVETPLMLAMPGAGTVALKTSLFAVRRRGTPSKVPFLVQAEDASMSTDMSVQSNDATASGVGSNYARCTFAISNLMGTRIFGAIGSAPSVDLRGTYRVLARMRHSVASDVIKVQLSWGPFDDVINDAVTLNTGGSHPTEWQYYDLGLVQMPPGLDPVHDGYSGVELPVGAQGFKVQAQRVSGTGSFDIDYLLFVPADDKLLFVKWTAYNSDIVELDGAHETALMLDSGGASISISFPAQLSGGFPAISPGVTNRVYFLRQVGNPDLSADPISDYTVITPSYYPRYLYVRPVTT